MNNYHKLTTAVLENIEQIDHPEQDHTMDLDSSALSVFTDFRKQAPLMLEQGTSIDEAIETMRRTHVKLKLVIDASESFRGVISMADLLSSRVTRASEETGLKRKDLTVAHVMTRKHQLHAVDLQTLKSARVGDVLATMESFGDQYVLVTDRNTGSLRGIVSATGIARGLHVPVSISARANSFAEIYRAVRG